MMKKQAVIFRPKLGIPLIILTLFLIGCSSGTGNPVEPLTDPIIQTPSQKQASNSSPSHKLWGLWQFTADMERQKLDVTPLRSAEWHQNVLPFLEPPVLTKLTIDNLVFTNGIIIDVDIGLTHPFPDLDEFTGFDVCGIVFTLGTHTRYGGGVTTTRPRDTRLMNPDGYSRWWNPFEFPHVPVYGYTDGLLGAPDSYAGYNCNINGYKYFCDDLSANEELSGIPLDSRGQFSPGKTNTRHYKIEIGSTHLTFNYAVDACWMLPEGPGPWDVPEDFPEGANRPEPYRLEVTEVDNSLYYEDFPPSGGGSAQLHVDVYDWYNVSEITLTCRTDCGIPPTLNITPSEVNDGYATFIVNLDGSSLFVNGDVELLFICKSEESGYQNCIPGEPVCAYLPCTINIIDPTPDQGWGHTWGYKALTTAEGSALDHSDNVYVTGYFDYWGSYPIDFDPGPGVCELESNGGYDVCLSKFHDNGSFLWACGWGDIHEDKGYDAACDSLGNVYVTGFFKGTVDFDPGPGVAQYTSIIYESEYGPEPTRDVFLSKFNSAGQFQWARTWGGKGCMPYGGEPDIGYGVAVDSNDNIYVTGCFNDIVDLDPGPGEDIHDGGSLNSWDVFIVKYDPDGNYLWGRTWGGSDEDVAYGMTTDLSGNVFITGYYESSTDFDPGPGTDYHAPEGSNRDAFLSKFDSDGNFQWAKTWGSPGDYRNSDEGKGVCTDQSGNIFVGGEFSGYCDFDPGSGINTHVSEGLGDAFVSKFNPSGDFLWARTWGAQDGDWTESVAADPLGYVYAASAFNYPIDFDTGTTTDRHIPYGYWDIALSKFAPDGDYRWSRAWGSDNTDWPAEVLVDTAGAVYLAGRCYFPIDLDPGPEVDMHNTGPSGMLIRILADGYW